MNHEDILSRLTKHYNQLKPQNAPTGLFELVEPVVMAVLETAAYTMSLQAKQISELKRELDEVKLQVKQRGKQ